MIVAFALCPTSIATAGQGQPTTMRRLLERFAEECDEPSLSETLEPLISRARDALASGRGTTQDQYAFWLGTLALAWYEARETGHQGPHGARLGELLKDPGQRQLLFTATVLIQTATSHEKLGVADDFSSWFRETLDPSPIEFLPLLVTWVPVKRRLGRPGEAETLLIELEQSLAELAQNETLPGWERNVVIDPARINALLLRSEGWSALGVIDQAETFAAQGLALAKGLGRPSVLYQPTLAVANVFLVSGRFSFALRTLEAYLDTDPQLAPGMRRQVELSRAVALAELEREDQDLERLAEPLFRKLAATADDRVAARAWLELADILLREHLEDSIGGSRKSTIGKDEVKAEIKGALASAHGILAKGGDAYSVSDDLGVILAANEARLALVTESDTAQLKSRLAATIQALDALLEQARRVPSRPGGIGILHVSHRRMLISSLIRLEVRLHGEERGASIALQRLLDVQGRGALSLQLGAERVRLDQRKNWLAKGHGVLLYLPERYMVHLFAFDAQRFMHLELPAPSSFRASLDRFTGALGSDPIELEARPQHILAALETESLNLSETLLPEKLRGLVRNWDGVTVVGAEYFSGLPFECLSLEPAGPLLGLSHAVENVPSLSVSLAVARRAGVEPDLDLLLAVVLRKADAEIAANRIELTRDELRSVARGLADPFDRGRSRVLTGEQATWAALTRLGAGGSSMMHLLAHGGYDRRRERGACLIVAPDEEHPGGLVYPGDVEQASLPTGLVLLSACGAARGPRRLGADNLQHLGGAFLRAGAGCVVLTRADVTLAGSVFLSNALQRAYVDGASAGEALRRAREAVAEEYGPLGAFLAGRVQLVGAGSRTFRR